MTAIRPRYGQYSEEGMEFWDIERIWKLAEDLPAKEVSIDEIHGPDEVTWFAPGQKPTCRAIAEHCRRINATDLSYPIILTEDFRVFDGMHRIAKCIMEGRTHILAKRFEKNPPPDEVVRREDL